MAFDLQLLPPLLWEATTLRGSKTCISILVAGLLLLACNIPQPELDGSSEARSFSTKSDEIGWFYHHAWDTRSLTVCFEFGTFPEERRWIRQQIEDTWQIESKLRLLGWGVCGSANIRIAIYPGSGSSQVFAFSKDIDNLFSGITIRTPTSWPLPEREMRVRMDAVRLFGNALGFTQEGAGAPDWCRKNFVFEDPKYGAWFGQWDAFSAMSDCSAIAYNEGELSQRDMSVLQIDLGAENDPPGFGAPNLGGSRDRFQRMDIDADGRDDLLTRSVWGSFEVWKGTASGLVRSGEFSTDLTDQAGWNSPHRIFVMDFDGDHRDDLVARGVDGVFRVYRSNGATLYYWGLLNSNVALTDANGWNTANRFFVLNVDNDHKDELIIRYSWGDLGILKFNGTQLEQIKTVPTHLSDANGWLNGNRFLVADVDGNDKKDLIARYAVGDLETWASGNGTLTRYSYSSFSQTKVINTATSTLTVTDQRFDDRRGWNDLNRFFPMDIEGDGDDDLIIRYVNGDLNVLKNVTDSSGRHYFASANGFKRMEADFRNSTGWKYGNRYFPMNVLGQTGGSQAELWVRFANGVLQPWTWDGTKLAPSAGMSTSLSDANGWNDGYRFF